MKARRSQPHGTAVVAATLMLALWVPVFAHGKAPHSCQPGEIDHGAGMVAHALPSGMREKVETLIGCLRAHNEKAFLPRAQTDNSPPHVSLAYGVDAAATQSVAAAMQSSGRAEAAKMLLLQGATTWHDHKRKTSVLVMLVADASSTLTHWHDLLTPLVAQPRRFAYTPHVTLGHLRYQHAVDFSACQRPLAVLSDSMWPACGVYLTDRCGQTIWQQACK